MFADLLFVHVWYKHLFVSTCLLLLGPSCIAWEQLLALCATTLVFGCVEKTLKEEWVLFDSFKKAHNIYLKLVDRAPFPTLVTDAQGHVLYWNTVANQLFPGGGAQRRAERRSRNLLDLVQADSQEKVGKLLKKAITGATFDAEFQLCDVDPPRSRETPPKEEECPTKSSRVESPKGRTEHRTSAQSLQPAGRRDCLLPLGFKSVSGHLERCPWKSANGVVLTLQDSPKNKAVPEAPLRSQRLVREQLQSVCGS